MIMAASVISHQIQCSFADSERAFSRAGFIDDPLRGRLNDEGLADLVLIRDWALCEGVEKVSEEIFHLLSGEEE